MKHVQERFLLVEAILVQLLICIGLLVLLPMLTFRLGMENLSIHEKYFFVKTLAFIRELEIYLWLDFSLNYLS